MTSLDVAMGTGCGDGGQIAVITVTEFGDAADSCCHCDGLW